jgi:hypothetical protein
MTLRMKQETPYKDETTKTPSENCSTKGAKSLQVSPFSFAFQRPKTETIMRIPRSAFPRPWEDPKDQGP